MFDIFGGVYSGLVSFLTTITGAMRPNIVPCLIISLCISTTHSSTLRPLKSFCRDRTGPTARCFSLYRDPATWSEARNRCSRVSMALGVIDTGEVQQYVSRNFVALSDQAFARERTQQAWVAAARSETGDSWRWTDGSPKGDDAVFESTTEGHNCAVVQFTPPSALVINSKACNEIYVDFYICAYFSQDCRGDPEYAETIKGRVCIAAYKVFTSWFEARRRCKAHGGDLVSLTDVITRDVLWSFLRRVTNEGRWAVWIGLNRYPWTWTYPNGSRRDMQFYNWAPGETFEANCVSVDLSSTGNGRWRCKNCSSTTLPFYICENSTTHISPTTSTTSTHALPTSSMTNSTNAANAGDGLSTEMIAAVAVAVSLAAILLLVTAILCKLWRNKRTHDVTGATSFEQPVVQPISTIPKATDEEGSVVHIYNNLGAPPAASRDLPTKNANSPAVYGNQASYMSSIKNTNQTARDSSAKISKKNNVTSPSSKSHRRTTSADRPPVTHHAHVNNHVTSASTNRIDSEAPKVENIDQLMVEIDEIYAMRYQNRDSRNERPASTELANQRHSGASFGTDGGGAYHRQGAPYNNVIGERKQKSQNNVNKAS